MLKNKLFLILLLFVFLSSHGSYNSIVVKASDEKLNNFESPLLYRPNYDGRIVFSSNARGNNYNLYVADAGGGDLHEITHEPGDEINPSISPDGNFVAYAQNNEGDWNITIMEIDSENRWNLTHCCHDETNPDWSDWDRIAYQSNKYGNWDIMWKDAFGPEWDGGTSEDMEITNSPQSETNPAWGRYNFASMIAYVREGDIWAFDDNMRQEFRTPASGGGNQVLPLWYPGEDIFPNSRGPALIYKEQEKPGLMWTGLDGGNRGPLLRTQDQNPRNIPVISASFGLSPETIGFVPVPSKAGKASVRTLELFAPISNTENTFRGPSGWPSRPDRRWHAQPVRRVVRADGNFSSLRKDVRKGPRLLPQLRVLDLGRYGLHCCQRDLSVPGRAG